jgi:hypothetical protein
VPGGEVVLGYDGAWFTPTPGQAADYAAWPDGLPSDIRAFVDFVTSASWVVHLPTLLVGVEAVEPGARPADPDDPRVRELLADLQTSWEHDRPSGMIRHYDWGRVEVTVDERCQLIRPEWSSTSPAMPWSLTWLVVAYGCSPPTSGSTPAALAR